MSLLSIFRNPGSSVSQRQKTGWIGIDIGTAAIKLAQLQRSGGRLHIIRSLVIHADDHNPFDLQSFSSGRVGEAIREALQGHGGFRGRETACVVSMDHCQLRTLVSAKGTEDEQRELISLEIENDHRALTVPQEFEFWDASNGVHGEQRNDPAPCAVHSTNAFGCCREQSAARKTSVSGSRRRSVCHNQSVGNVRVVFHSSDSRTLVCCTGLGKFRGYSDGRSSGTAVSHTRTEALRHTKNYAWHPSTVEIVSS